MIDEDLMRSDRIPNLKGRALKKSEIKNLFEVTKFVPTSKRYLNRQPNESVRDAIERAKRKPWWAEVTAVKPMFNARFWWWSVEEQPQRHVTTEPTIIDHEDIIVKDEDDW